MVTKTLADALEVWDELGARAGLDSKQRGLRNWALASICRARDAGLVEGSARLGFSLSRPGMRQSWAWRVWSIMARLFRIQITQTDDAPDSDEQRIERLAMRGHLGMADRLGGLSREELEATRWRLGNDLEHFQAAQTYLRAVFAQPPKRREETYQDVLIRLWKAGSPAAEHLPEHFDTSLEGQFRDMEFSIELAVAEVDIALTGATDQQLTYVN